VPKQWLKANTGINMIVTQFLPFKQFPDYGTWLKSQDAETRQLYFGMAATDYVVDSLVSRIIADPSDHYILVALKKDQWVGTIHIAVNGSSVEFGIIVDQQYRGQGIGNQLIEEAILWARNRGYQELFMHCITSNTTIRHLCNKHGLRSRNMLGETEVNMPLDLPNWVTISKEVVARQRSFFHLYLQNTTKFYEEIYG